ncbi:hypothetical protein BDZ91DRAFT_750095 [Kalaharituber pfeilii]|nr:hypothetical protein BDZ91DRAFT_750095 [Kalaharituber pfeilii]
MENQTQRPPFQDMDILISHLTSIEKKPEERGESSTVNRIPIVLVPGFLDWAAPTSGFYNYFGSCIDLATVLAGQGWPVIVPQLGPLSSAWERACELYALLSHESKDGKTFDVSVDYGSAPQGVQNLFYTDSPPWRRQAMAYNLDPNWQWGSENPVHFLAHGHGGNTCRYLIYLLERGSSAEGSWYFTEQKKGWVKSLTTLGTPHNGTTFIPVLEDMGRTEEILINKLIAASSFMEPSARTYDFCLDHRGVAPPTPPDPNDPSTQKVDFETYLADLTAPDGALTQWRASTYNGFHDNSITGVVGGLNKVIGSPSTDVYYFTLSFSGTVDLPGVRFGMGDAWAMGKQWVEQMLSTVIGGEGVSEDGGWRMSAVDPLGLFFSRPLIQQKPKAPLLLPPSAPILPNLVTFVSSTLQDIALWSFGHVNARLANAIPRPHLTTTRPRMDIWSLLFIWSFRMCGYVLSPTERKAVASVGGPTNCREWHEHDGIVPTCSQAGPWGTGNKISTVNELLSGLPWGRGREIQEEVKKNGLGLQKGVWVNLGKCDWMDHVHCMGLFVNPPAIEEVKQLYTRIGNLLEALPSD